MVPVGCARIGLEFLRETGDLQEVVLHGMGPQVWLELTKKLAAVASGTGHHHICVSQPLKHAARATRARLNQAIGDAIVHGRAVLISLSGIHDHYTVVSGYSPFSLWLFDSGHLQRLGRGDCGTLHGGDKWRHRINARTLTVLTLTPDPKQAVRP